MKQLTMKFQAIITECYPMNGESSVSYSNGIMYKETIKLSKNRQSM